MKYITIKSHLAPIQTTVSFIKKEVSKAVRKFNWKGKRWPWFLFSLGMQFFRSVTLALTNKGTFASWGQAFPTQLEPAVWRTIQRSPIEWMRGINKACGWTHKHKTQSNSFSFQQSYTSTLCSSVPKAVTHRNGTATLLRRASQSHYVGSHFTVLCCLSFSEPCILTTPSFLFDFSFPHSCLACVPRQMVHASRCSPPQSMWRKNKAWMQSKQNLLEGAHEIRREVHCTINHRCNHGSPFYRQVERTHAGDYKNKTYRQQSLLLPWWW